MEAFSLSAGINYNRVYVKLSASEISFGVTIMISEVMRKDISTIRSNKLRIVVLIMGQDTIVDSGNNIFSKKYY
jgi:hypothetical protein